MKTWGLAWAVMACLGLMTVGCDKKEPAKTGGGAAGGGGGGGGGADYKAASALSLLKDAQDRVKDKGTPELARINGNHLGENGKADLTKEGAMLQYQFKCGDKFWVVNYTGMPAMPTQNPYISVAEATVAAEKAFGKDDVGKFKDTTDLAKAAKDAGVDLKDATKGSYSYYIRTDKAEVWITNTGDGKNAGFEATTGKKVE